MKNDSHCGAGDLLIIKCGQISKNMNEMEAYSKKYNQSLHRKNTRTIFETFDYRIYHVYGLTELMICQSIGINWAVMN